MMNKGGVCGGLISDVFLQFVTLLLGILLGQIALFTLSIVPTCCFVS